VLQHAAWPDERPSRFSLLKVEALLGLLNGVLVGIVAATCMYVVAVVKHLPNALMLSVVVFLAMIGSCVISGACGAVTA
jgi:magnesium transporter